MPRRLRLSLCVLALLPGLAWAARPLDTEDPGTVPPGKLEIQGSADYVKSDDGRLAGVRGVVGVGLLPTMDVRVQSGLLWVDPPGEPARGGLGDSLFGFKHRLLDETDARPAVLYSLTLRLPTGSAPRGLGATGVDAALFAVVGKTFGPLTLTGNGGYAFVSQDRALDVWLLSGAFEYRVSEAWSLVGEVASTLGVRQAPDVAVLRAGATYTLAPWVRLDGAVAVGVTRESPDVLATVGVTMTLF